MIKNADYQLAFGVNYSNLVLPFEDGVCGEATRPFPRRVFILHPSIITMKNLERITLLTATAVYVGYLIKQALSVRSERVYRLAAGESPYERTHPKPRAPRKVLA